MGRSSGVLLTPGCGARLSPRALRFFRRHTRYPLGEGRRLVPSTCDPQRPPDGLHTPFGASEGVLGTLGGLRRVFSSRPSWASCWPSHAFRGHSEGVLGTLRDPYPRLHLGPPRAFLQSSSGRWADKPPLQQLCMSSKKRKELESNFSEQHINRQFNFTYIPTKLHFALLESIGNPLMCSIRINSHCHMPQNAIKPTLPFPLITRT